MAIEVEYVVRCNECLTIYDWRQFVSKTEALRIVRNDGWVGGFARLLCPACFAALYPNAPKEMGK